MSALSTQSFADLQSAQPNDTEQKQSASQDDEIFLGNTAYNIVNPLVLAICISAYDSDRFKTLPGAKKDMESLIKLFKDTFGFDMISNKISKKTNEYRVSESKFFKKLDETRLKLSAKKDNNSDSDSDSDSSGSDSDKNDKKKYDGLIFVFAGHGYEDGIFTSDGKRIRITKIKTHFSSKNVPLLKDSPKIFIIDACRHASGMLPFLDNMLYRDPSFDALRGGSEQLLQFKFYHPFVNMLQVFGNTRGYSVYSSVERGGSLVSLLSKYLTHFYKGKNINNMRFQQILNAMKRELHKTTGGNQTIEINDTLLYDIQFNNRSKSGSNTATNGATNGV